MDSPRVIVVGGGVAGLVAAVDLLAAGADVTVLERTPLLGGRAHTTDDDGFRRNLGPHAVYRRGALARSLRDAGVPIPGRPPALARAKLAAGTDTRTVIGRFGQVAGTAVRMLGSPARGQTVAEWLDDRGLDGLQRQLALALIRTATYSNAPDLQDAVSAHQQVRLAGFGVTYVDGGWQTLVDGLADRVRHAGGRIAVSDGVAEVACDDDADGGVRVRGVVLRDGHHLPADGVVLAVGGPREVAGLLPEPAAAAMRRVSEAVLPVRMATLDLALAGLPDASSAQVFGVGEPVYLLAQSEWAHLAPADGAVVHVARYLAPNETADVSTRRELEGWLDQYQPRWRDLVVEARFLPSMTVTHALPLAPDGLGGRPPVDVAGIAGLVCAGDGFGDHGQISDAAAASARAAAARLSNDLRRRADRGTLHAMTTMGRT